MPLTIDEIANAETDVGTLAAVVNGGPTDPDVVNRSGLPIKTLARVMAELDLGYEPPVAYAAGIHIDRRTQTVTYLSETFAPDPAHVPFITAAFDPTQWRLLIGKAVGLLKDAHLSAVPDDVGLVQTSGNEVVGQGPAIYMRDATVDLVACPKAGFTDTRGQKFRIVSEQPLNSQQFYDATDASYGQCIQRGLDYLQQQIGINGGGPDVYRGCVPFRVPAVRDDMVSNIPIDIRANVEVFGDGEGDGISDYGATHIHFTGTSGFRIQFPNTYDDSSVVVGPDLPGVARAKLHGFMLTGDLTLNKHAIVQRAPADIYNIYGRDWGGSVIRAWTGNARGGAYAGQCSTSSVKQVKGENCLWTLSVGGTDSSVYNTDGINGFQNRQGGLEDFNAAGANKHRGCHFAYNGYTAIPGVDRFTMCSYSGNIYTPDIQCVDFTDLAATSALLAAHAPSGSTLNNGYWVYIRPGAPSAAQPAYASGGPWTYGGDTFVLTPWSTEFDHCYFEGGGPISQSLYRHPVWRGGTLAGIVGGTVEISTDDGLEVIRSGASAHIVRGGNNAAGSYSIKDASDFLWWQIYATFGGTVAYYVYNDHYFINNGGLIGHIGTNGLDLVAGKTLSFGGVDVLNGRMAAIADLAAAPTMADFNGLLAKLRGVKLLTP